VDTSNTRDCKDYVEMVVVNKAWNVLEHDRIWKEIQSGDDELEIEIEKSLRNAREIKDAEKAMMREEQLDRERFQK
jgi:hypothetical protein